MKKNILIPIRYILKKDWENKDEICPVTFERVRSAEYRGERWAVRYHSTVLGKDGLWAFEPSPSNRTKAFYKNYRFNSLEAAMKIFETAKNKN